MAKTKKKNVKDVKSVGVPTEVVSESKHLHHHNHNQTKSIFKNSPVYELLHYFERAPDQWAARYILILTAIILRTAVGLGTYSGFKTPPMFGDFEAQRHWMELTINLPISEWYYFDLQYWGLDYPPLTAYHSYFLGMIGSFINSAWFAFNDSRGAESNDLKFFMRVTSIISELILYIPAILLIANLLGKKFNIGRMDQIIVSLIILTQPHLILIDHGHFQYNSVMLGFFVYSVIELVNNNLIMASFWFVSCINFKQMGLYYSLFIFFYILNQIRDIFQLILVGATVLITQFIYVLPFAATNPESLKQIVIRVFPFNRGLFEDKVANFWCTTNTLLKYRNLNLGLSQLSLIATLLATIPVNCYIFYKIKKNHKLKIPLLLYGFASNALSFYLFSFQVHEKSILVPLVPILLLLFIDKDNITIIQWINNIGTFSLYPLLKKDGLIMQYIVLQFLINWLIGFDLILPKKLNLNNLVINSTYFLMIIYHFIDALYSPPIRILLFLVILEL
ncbi:unnamed protein product [Candida verbasci]|uniref:Alpha-1,3-glucosyltransferase n=1 Tax=Candida verbasci TaxID=1227364 RepID=A0A9W4TRQ1_9ASCO|nr:unnamed protein product [Candida verbasci]